MLFNGMSLLWKKNVNEKFQFLPKGYIFFQSTWNIPKLIYIPFSKGKTTFNYVDEFGIKRWFLWYFIFWESASLTIWKLPHLSMCLHIHTTCRKYHILVASMDLKSPERLFFLASNWNLNCCPTSQTSKFRVIFNTFKQTFLVPR